MFLIDSTQNKYFQGLAKYTQERLAKDSEITTDYSREGVWVLNYVSFKNGVHKKIKGDYVVIQTEQMNAKGTDEYRQFISKAKEVLDWRHNYKIGYSDVWRMEMEEAKDIDVLFFGEMNERRRNILDKIPNVTILTGVYGAELQKFVMRSKIVLSVHYYEQPDNDLPRIAPLLSNRAFVIAERCEEKWFNYIDSIVIVDKDEIVDEVQFYLQHPELRLSMIDIGYNFIRNFR